jgi:hypothetical protein
MPNHVPRWAALFLFLSILLGAIVRFTPTVLAGGPINDGGMFYAMIQDLRANGFLLPATTSYNNLDIPFAYPPLALYLGGLLSEVGVPTLDIIRWIPPLVSSLSILAFYWMTSIFITSKTKAALAVMAYALMPRSFSWYVMGGGLSRSLGIFFLLLTCGSAWALFSRNNGWKYIFLTAMFGAGAVLSHPETGLHAAAICLLIWLFRGRTRRGARNALFVAFGVLMFTSLWWARVLVQHGFGPFRSALQTGGQSGLFWVSWLTFDFAQEPFVTLLTVLGLIGLAVQCIRREWFLPAWVFLPFIIEPRSAPAIAALPLAILVAYGLNEVVLPGLASLRSNTHVEGRDLAEYMSVSPAARIVMGYVLFLSFFAAFAFDLSLAKAVIPPESRVAMQWVQYNTPSDAQFIVLTGSGDPFADASAEWFPVLSGRTSVNTLQGRGWLLGKSFMSFLNSLGTLETCLNQAPSCVEIWARSNRQNFDYIYLQEPEDKNASQPSGLLLYQLRHDQYYQLVFENDGAAIFERK